jgi:hypothetical protein
VTVIAVSASRTSVPLARLGALLGLLATAHSVERTFEGRARWDADMVQAALRSFRESKFPKRVGPGASARRER